MSVRPLMGTAIAVFVVLAVVPARSQSCERPPLDCAREDAAFARRARAIVRRFPDLAEAIEALRFRRLAWCHDRNACGIDDRLLERLRSWTDNELGWLEVSAADDYGRAAWIRSLPRRASQTTQAVIQSAPPVPLVSTRREEMVRLEADIESFVAVQAPLTRLVAAVEVDERPPSVCRSQADRELRQVIREGGAAASLAGRLREVLDAYCTPFERHANPDETLQNRMRRFLTGLTRIEGWMNEILRCVDPGPYDGYCRNAYGPLRSDTAEQARAALRMVGQVRQAVDGIPEMPFPCRHPIWERVERSRWTLGTAHVQVPSLARDARSLCAAIGVDDSSVESARRRLREEVERATVSVAEGMRNQRRALARVRASLGLEP